MLEERRTRARTLLFKILNDGVAASCGCGWGSNRGQTFSKILEDYGTSTTPSVPLSNISARMATVSMEDTAPIQRCRYKVQHLAIPVRKMPCWQLAKLPLEFSIGLDTVRKLGYGRSTPTS
jgi:hypothetical protein